MIGPNGNGNGSGNGAGNLFTMPSAPEAERAILGCITEDSALVFPNLERAGVNGNWFYDLKNSLWFNLFRIMHRDRDGIDVVTVSSRLKTHPSSSELGGIQGFIDLQTGAPSPHNWPYYIPDLKNCFIRRKTISAAYHAIRTAENPELPFSGLLQDLDASLRSLSPDKPLPEIIGAREFADQPLDEPKLLIKGLLHQGTKFALGGGSKTCKTWVLLDLAMSVAAGIDFIGLTTHPAPVLFINLEIHPKFFQRRVSRVCREKGIDVPSNLHIWNLRGYDASASLLLPMITERIKLGGYGLVIIDPIYKTYGDLKENAAEDMSRLLNQFEKVAFETGCAIGFAAHFSKGNQSQKETIDRISGSGVFARDPDTIITMTALEKEGTFALEATLRNLPPFKPFAVQWKYPLMSRNDDLDPTKLKKAGGKPKGYEESKVGAILVSKPLTTVQWQKLASNELGVSRASFYRCLRDLETSKSVIKSTLDGTWILNQKPQELVPEPD